MKPCAFHPEADEEYADAARYYTRTNPELGGRFYDEIERLIGTSDSNPAAFAALIRPFAVTSPTPGSLSFCRTERKDRIFQD